MNIMQLLCYVIILDLLKWFATDPLQDSLDRTLNIIRNKNTSIVTIAYVASIENRPYFKEKRLGRYISGALTYAIYKINTMAQKNDSKSLLPHNYQINVKFMETYGERNVSIEGVANISVRNEVWAIIGPQDSCKTEADIAASFNILMISHFCTDNIFNENPEIYSTYIRTRPQLSGLAESLVSFLKKFNWKKVAIIASSDKENQFILQNCVEVLKENNITILQILTFRSPAIPGSVNDKFIKIVEKTYQTSRIYVFFGADFEVSGLLRELFNRNLTDTGDYFVISIMLRYETLKDKFLGTKMLQSFRNFVVISHIKPEVEIMKKENNMFKRFIKLPPFNVNSSDVQNYHPIESSYLYDAVWVYATALGKVLRNHSIGSPKNGRLLKSLIINQNYQSVFGFVNRIDNKGDSCGNYTVNQIKKTINNTWEMETIGFFKQNGDSNLEFSFLKNKDIDWVRNIPRDVPECGFHGEICKTKEKIILIIVGLFILIVIIMFILAFIIRSKKYEQELERLLWKIDKIKEIDLTNPELLEKFSFITRPPFMEEANGNVFLPFEEEKNICLIAVSCCNIGVLPQSDWLNSKLLLGMFKNQEVVIKRIFFNSTLSITRKVKKELKSLREISFMNLNKFMGAIIEHQDTWVVWEFCDRGSLQDVLYSTKLTKDYPVFLNSFALDVIRGLCFIHDNPDIGYHGHLKSSNCLVDSRWTIKLTDYGMTEFLTYMMPPPDMPEFIYFISLFWTSPEILRNIIQNKYQNNTFLKDFKLTFITAENKIKDNKYDDYFINEDSCLETFIKKNMNPNKLDTTNYQKGDIYSFGMIFYELFSCQIPFLSNYCTQNSPKEIIRRVIVLNDEFKVPYRPKLSLLSKTEEKQIEVIKSCWQENPNQRPTAKAIYNRFKFLFGDKKNLVECMKEKMILYTKNLEKEVMKRTEELREEKKQNEELLYQMLPIPVAEQLRQHKQVEAEAFDSVTIYFSDIVGFTELSGSCSPFEIVNLLNQLYTSFDNIIDNFKVYKVETIGDSYMVVSGLPTHFDEHAKEMANMSLRLLEEITKGFVIPSKNHENESLKLRIGLHSGPCCAGVVGTRNPRYCLFGDTVNMASRMESTGEALKIHCSEAFILQIAHLNEFSIIERGMIEVKGKGFVTTFWLIEKLKKNTSSIKSIHNQYIDSFIRSPFQPEITQIGKSSKNKSRNIIFDKIKENALKNKCNHKKDIIKVNDIP